MKYQRLLNYLTYLPLGLSMFSLCTMTYERYMGVLFPLQHRTKVTKKKLLKFQCSCGLLTIMMMAISLKYEIIYKVYSVIVVTALILFIAFAYIKIFVTARKGTFLQHQPCGRNCVENTCVFNQKGVSYENWNWPSRAFLLWLPSHFVTHHRWSVFHSCMTSEKQHFLMSYLLGVYL